LSLLRVSRRAHVVRPRTVNDTDCADDGSCDVRLIPSSSQDTRQHIDRVRGASMCQDLCGTHCRLWFRMLQGTLKLLVEASTVDHREV
jgi:hypothetical protein